MPRKTTKIDAENLKVLKEQVLLISKIKLNRSVDCDTLAKVVSTKTKEYINGISFKRLFGFTKYPFNPSIQTLNILSRFVGVNSWYDFESSLNDKHPISKQELDIYLSSYDMDFVNNIEPHEGGLQSISRKIAIRFREDPNTLLRNVDYLVNKPYAQIFFVEHFPDYDNLCTYYYKVIESYLKFKQTKEAQLFGNCMLFLKSFWLLNKNDCGKYLILINKLTPDLNIHPYIIGRFYACNLLYNSFFKKGESIEKIYSEFLNLRKRLPKNGNHFYDFPAAEYIVSEALFHCKEYQKCIDVIELSFKDFHFKMEFVRKGYYRQMQLLWLLSSKKINIKTNIEEPLKKINPKNFYFISQKYFSVLYFYTIGTEESLNKAKQLSSEMGNKYLQEVLLKNP